MPKPFRIPKLTRHKASGQAVVRLNGKDHYLGPFDAPNARREYDRLVAEWLANHRLPIDAPSETDGEAQTGVTVNELILAFWGHVGRHYRRPDGTPTSEATLKLDIGDLSLGGRAGSSWGSCA